MISDFGAALASSGSSPLPLECLLNETADHLGSAGQVVLFSTPIIDRLEEGDRWLAAIGIRRNVHCFDRERFGLLPVPYRNTCALQKHLDEQEEKQEGHQEKPELIHRGNQRRIHVHDLIRSNRD